MNQAALQKRLINENIIKQEATITIDPLSGGTTSKVFLVKSSDGLAFILKKNRPEVIKEEAAFLSRYRNVSFLPTLLHASASNEYILYSYLEGTSTDPKKNKEQILSTLVKQFLNHLLPISSKGCGWPEAITDSWGHFLEAEVAEAKHELLPHLNTQDHLMVSNLIVKIKQAPLNNQAYLLHGDCGVHNFIFQGEELSGVIDPTPVIGEPIYDLIYAFCSSPHELTKEVIDGAAADLVVGSAYSGVELYEYVVIGLYLRMSTCIRHHPDDLADYLISWRYWKKIVTAV